LSEKSPIAIASLDWEGSIEFQNISWRKRFSGESAKDFLLELNSEISGFRKNSLSFCQLELHTNGEDLEVSIHKIKSLNQMMVFVENITERVKAKQELEFLAYNDPVTGLANIKKLEMDIDEQIKRDSDNRFLLLTIGIKQLKLVSSTHGYSVSDALMSALPLRIQSMLLPITSYYTNYRVYRFTGAKFCVLLSQPKSSIDTGKLFSALNSSLTKSMQKPLQTVFGSFYLDFQAGCVTYPDNGYSAGLLIKNANAAVSEAQKQNVKEVVQFDQTISENEQRWYRLENDLRTANFDSDFYLVYQPKVDINTNKMASMEALVRWNHPEEGNVSPVEFIPIAEEGGVIHSLGLWVLRKACEQTKIWHTKGLTSLQVAVNVSPSQLLSANFIDCVTEALNEFDLEAKFLEIEITEEVMVKDQDTCISVLKKIHEMGISIAVDDFGTGYSSLGYLNRFPLSKLKIDRSFVTNIHQDKSNNAIVRAIIALSMSLKVKVIAEGIETDEELTELKTLGCNQGQGYLFDKPLSVEKFTQRYLKN